MTQCFRTFKEDQGVVPSIHMAASNHLQVHYQGSDALFWIPQALRECEVQTCTQSKHSYP